MIKNEYPELTKLCNVGGQHLNLSRRKQERSNATIHVLGHAGHRNVPEPVAVENRPDCSRIGRIEPGKDRKNKKRENNERIAQAHSAAKSKIHDTTPGEKSI